MTRRPPVSACLLSWKRPHNLQAIVDSLHGCEFVGEILVWNNDPQVRLALRGAKVRVLDSAENMGCYGRFLCARQAQNDLIYVQDDDVIVGNLPALYRAFLTDDSRITHALSLHHYRNRERSVYPGGHVALLGWGAMFRKEWLSVLDACVEAYGLDDLFKREADKFFSLLLARRHNTLLAQVRALPGDRTPGIALYKEPRHRRMKALAVRRALEFLRVSKTPAAPVTWNVVIPCHNYAAYLPDAVDSVLLNDADYVITLVDDASTDGTPAVATALCRESPFISCIRHDRNVGVSAARNSGIAAVDSRYVVLLDADDRIGPDYLFRAEKLLGAGCDVANPDAILFGDRHGRWSVPERTTLPMLLRRNSVHYCAAFRRSFWARACCIDETMDNWQDYDFWIRLAAAGAEIRRLPGDHFFYRKHGHSKSAESARLRGTLRSYLRRKHHLLYARPNRAGRPAPAV